MSEFYQLLIFASDAEITALWGAGFVAMALLANLAERRRMKVAQIHRLGWVPWTGIFLFCLVIGAGLLAMALPQVLAG